MNIPSYTDIKKDIPDFNAGLCAQTDPELFFPGRNKSQFPALKLCADCPFNADCRRWGDTVEQGLHRYELFGILAGETPDARSRRRKELAA